MKFDERGNDERLEIEWVYKVIKEKLAKFLFENCAKHGAYCLPYQNHLLNNENTSIERYHEIWLAGVNVKKWQENLWRDECRSAKRRLAVDGRMSCEQLGVGPKPRAWKIRSGLKGVKIWNRLDGRIVDIWTKPKRSVSLSDLGSIIIVTVDKAFEYMCVV